MNNFPSYPQDMYGMQGMSPYSYQTPDIPQPTMMSPNPALPPLFPSMMTPQLNPPSPMTNYNLAQQRYARGGSVENHGLAYLAQLLRGAGQREDSVLAHINPQEARELGRKYGGDINPITGLPQYGKFSFKKIKKIAKHALPIAAGVAGSLLAPQIGLPSIAGGGLGGGLVGALTSKKPLQGALMGGLSGALAGPILGGGISGLTSGAGLMSGLRQGYDSGIGGMFGLGKSQGISSEAASTQAGSSGSSGFGGDLLDKALMGAAILGTLGRREKQHFPKEKFLSPEAIQNLSNQPTWSEREQPRNFTPLQQILRRTREDYRPGYDPEEIYFNYEPGASVNYREGGYVEGGSPGQEDDVDVMLPHGSYIIDANTVAQTGDGNSKAGTLWKL